MFSIDVLFCFVLFRRFFFSLGEVNTSNSFEFLETARIVGGKHLELLYMMAFRFLLH